MNCRVAGWEGSCMPMPEKPRPLCQCGCGREVSRPAMRFFSNQCQRDLDHRQYIERWKAGLETGLKGYNQISGYIRRYLIEKYGEKCARCGWCERHPATGRVPVEVEHIDGNYWNTVEENLVLLCPNCHSLTSTYRALNSGSGRPSRRAGVA